MIEVVQTSFPSLGRQLRNAALAAGRVVAAAASGERVMAPNAVRIARLLACDTCEHLAGGRCKLCGCCVGGTVLDKAMWATEGCPARPPKWERIND